MELGAIVVLGEQDGRTSAQGQTREAQEETRKKESNVNFDIHEILDQLFVELQGSPDSFVPR